VERAFFAPAGPRLLQATRAVLAAQALWIAVSRTDLPALASWPRAFWSGVDPLLPVRFGIGLLPAGLEHGLFALLLVALIATLFGYRPRLSGMVAAALLYHFAPMEEVLAGLPHTSFGGLTTPVVGLCVLSFAETPRADAPPSSEFRWPVALIRLFFSFSYLFPLLAKLRFAGPAWFTADNMRSWIMVNAPLTAAPWGPLVAASDALCWLVALTTLALELLFPLSVFSRRAALVLVPLAAAFHLGTALTLGYFFPSLPLLLLFVEWDVIRWRPRLPSAQPGAAAAAAR
jgi:hypothetical protein